MKIRHTEPYAPLRRQAYPSTGEQLDALFKMAQALQAQGITLPDETQNWVNQCAAIKQRFQKDN